MCNTLKNTENRTLLMILLEAKIAVETDFVKKAHLISYLGYFQDRQIVSDDELEAIKIYTQRESYAA